VPETTHRKKGRLSVMKKTKALCVFTTMLGNKKMAQRIMDALDSMPNIEPTYLLQTVEDYERYPAPRWARATNAWHSRYLARAKMAEMGGGPFDILLVNTWESVIEFRGLARHIPALAVMDAVPATVDYQLRRRGLGGWKRTAATLINDVPFRRAVRDYRYFLPAGSDAGDALATRYGVSRELITVTLAPQDLTLWSPGAKTDDDSFRLLFVANDFVRKGGIFLLRLYAEHLASYCTLTIVSNDTKPEGLTLPANVVWRRGINRDEILQAYRGSDLFVFPTEQDFMPQVVAEALSTGLPCMANDVGGIRDMVRNGETGFLMPCDTPAEVWSARIKELHTNRSELERLSKGARTFAEQHLDTTAFSQLLIGLVYGLGLSGQIPK
jgi:glycosyltransferase involved in cell wall biosynthesis